AVWAPDGEKQRPVCDHATGTSGEIKQKFEFLGSKADLAVFHHHAKYVGVDEEVSDFNFSSGSILGRVHTRQVAAHSRQQFVHTDGLSDIVVGSGVERFDLG